MKRTLGTFVLVVLWGLVGFGSGGTMGGKPSWLIWTMLGLGILILILKAVNRSTRS